MHEAGLVFPDLNGLILLTAVILTIAGTWTFHHHHQWTPPEHDIITQLMWVMADSLSWHPYSL